MKLGSAVLQCRIVEKVAFPAEITCQYVFLVKQSCEIPQNSVTIPEHALKFLNFRRQVPHVHFTNLWCQDLENQVTVLQNHRKKFRFLSYDFNFMSNKIKQNFNLNILLLLSPTCNTYISFEHQCLCLSINFNSVLYKSMYSAASMGDLQSTLVVGIDFLDNYKRRNGKALESADVTSHPRY